MTHIEIYGTSNCSFCKRAVEFATRNSLPYEYRDLAYMEHRDEFLRRAPHARTVPQIFIGDTHIGGYTELAATEVSTLKQMTGVE